MRACARVCVCGRGGGRSIDLKKKILIVSNHISSTDLIFSIVL